MGMDQGHELARLLREPAPWRDGRTEEQRRAFDDEWRRRFWSDRERDER